MSNDTPNKSVRHSLAGLARAARQTPEQRVAQMSELGKRSAAKREAARKAAGLPEPKPRSESTPLPSAKELEPYLREIDAEEHETPLSYDARYREAVLRLRLDVAAQTVAALNRQAEK